MKVVFVLLALAVGAYSLKLPQLKAAFSKGDIIDGVEAQRGEAPFIVSLQYLSSHFCAGSVINERWVLTAAHCLIYNSFSVVAGLHVRSDKTGVQTRKVANNKQYIIHEKYGGGVGPNDIGLIYLTEPLDLNALKAGGAPVSAIKLPSGQYAAAGDGTLYGWGKNRAGSSPQTLHKLETRGDNKYEGACNGDSGGPLVKYTPFGVEQVGIVSWGYTPCHTSTYPSVYTSVASFKDWINTNIANYIA
uniref:Peptidase S1 domain-containing protein n=1 Tax=Megaselia scalaris TaxID=36166 RepID=T1GEG8_MEGSC